MSKVIEIARSYVGQKEEPAGSNKGPFVTPTLAMVGINFPAPWCQAFAYRIYKEAGIETVRTPGVLDCWRKAPAAKKVLKKNANKHTVPPGSQFFMDFGKGRGHTGLVVSIEGNVIHTIEGNTDMQTGSRTGGSVCERTRSLTDAKLLGFVVW